MLLLLLLFGETCVWVLLVCHLHRVSWCERRFDWAELTTRMGSLLHGYLFAVFDLWENLTLLDDSLVRFALKNLSLVLGLSFWKVSVELDIAAHVVHTRVHVCTTVQRCSSCMFSCQVSQLLLWALWKGGCSLLVRVVISHVVRVIPALIILLSILSCRGIGTFHAFHCLVAFDARHEVIGHQLGHWNDTDLLRHHWLPVLSLI